MHKRRVFAITASTAVLGLGLTTMAVASGDPGRPETPARAASPAEAPGLEPQPRKAAVPAATECGYTEGDPKDRFKGLPKFDAEQAAKPYKARIHTKYGRITFEALTTKAPCTTFSFRFLAKNGYYDRTHCHRMTTQRIYVLQCGDPTGTGSGGPGYRFIDENLDGATYPAGTVAMANAGPSTNGSQFFFTWKDTTLRPNYTPFGRVTEGMDVLQRFVAAGEDHQNGPGDGFPYLVPKFQKVQIKKG